MIHGTASGILVAGTASDAGKSLLVTGLCRALARRGLRVAPFKAQNMSNNSMVCADGAEIGRAQFLQAQAAGVTPESAMNPVLLKPGSDRVSHIVVRGRPAGSLSAGEYATGRTHLARAAFDAYEELSGRFEIIVSEGAGSPAEINLRSGDYVNMGLARRFGLPVVVVGDIDRGGVFAALYGTVALLEPEDRALIKGFVINKFRGDPAVLGPGLDMLSNRTGVPFLGVLPWLPRVWLDGEDALAVGRWLAPAAPPRRSTEAASPAVTSTGTRPLRIAAVHLPRLSNATDLDPLAAEPGVRVSLVEDPGQLAGADVIVVPGTRSTIADLDWLRRTGLAAGIAAAAADGVTVLGICGGYQMLAAVIEDRVESGSGRVAGLDLLPVAVRFADDKVLARPVGWWRGLRVEGYEIHHGIASTASSVEPFLDGCRVGNVWGTMWHGIFENDGFRRAWLEQVGSGVPFRADPDAPRYAERREQMIETLADAVEEHVDVPALLDLTRAGVRV